MRDADASRPLDFAEVCELFGAYVALPVPADPLRSCPKCGTTTAPSSAGQRTLCLICTQAEQPGQFSDNSLRIEFRMTWAVYWTRVERFGLPWQSPHEWITPHSRNKR